MREERAVGNEVKRLSDKSRIRSEELNTERDSGESSDNLDDVRLNCLTLIFDLDGKIPPTRNEIFAPKILTESTILISISCKPELISEEVTFLQLNVCSF